MIQGSRHSRTCTSKAVSKDDIATTAALHESLQGGILLSEQGLQCLYIQQLTWEQVCEQQIVIFKTFPRSLTLRRCFEEVFMLVTKACVQSDQRDQEYAWKLLYLLPWMLLQQPHGKSSATPAQILHRRLRQFLHGSLQQLCVEAAANAQAWKMQTWSTTEPGDAQQLRRVQQLCCQGEVGKAASLLASDSTLTSDEHEHVARQINELLLATPYPMASPASQLQPPPLIQQSSQRAPVISPPSLPPTPQQQPQQQEVPQQQQVQQQTCLTLEALQSALSRFAVSAPGPGGWHISALKSLSEAAHPRILEILGLLLDEKAPQGFSQALAAGSLTVLLKPSGGVRPIITRSTWLRLLAKTICEQEQRELAATLQPLQCGVGSSGGPEFVAHSVRSLVQQHPDWMVLAVDCSNAYGTISRETISQTLQQVSTTQQVGLICKYFAAFCKPAFRASTRLHQYVVAEGVVQGDPLSPLLFALGLQSAVRKTADFLQNQAPDSRVFAYLDDVTVVAPASVISAAFAVFQQCARDIGLSVNMSKTQLFSLQNKAEAEQLANTSRWIYREHTVTILGTPVGDPAAESQAACDLVQEKLFVRLKQLQSKQVMLILLRASVNQQYAYLARTLPPNVSVALAKHVDRLTISTVASLLEVEHLQPLQVREIQLPVAFGGLGLTSLTATRTEAFVASAVTYIQQQQKFIPNQQIKQSMIPAALTSALQHLQDKWQGLDTALSRTFPKTVENILTLPKQEDLQRRLCSLQHAASVRQLRLVHLKTKEDNAQYLSKTARGASAFLDAIPSDRGLTLSNAHFTGALRLYCRLPLLPLFNVKSELACFCSEFETCTEQHIVNCAGDNLREARHSSIIQTIQRMLQTTGLKPTLEPNASEDKTNRHRYDLSVDVADESGSSWKLDVSVRSPWARKILKRAAAYQLTAANDGVSAKQRHYNRFLTQDQRLIPMIFETFGGVSQGVFDVLRIAARRVNNVAPDHAAYTAPTFAAYWLQQVSCSLMRENIKLFTTIVERSKALTGIPGAEPHKQAEEPSLLF